jgi:hypothetical protein
LHCVLAMPKNNEIVSSQIHGKRIKVIGCVM